MREIKFRAWNGKGFVGKTDFKWYIDPKGRVCWMERYDNDDWGMASTSTWTLMQFTGLLDKNGVEIYEGDVVNTIMPGFIRYDFKSKVVFKEGSFGIEGLEELALVDNAVGMYKSFTGCNTEKLIEVIGNIYENPELLNGKDITKKGQSDE